MLEPGEARAITISQTYDADINDVWDACTNPDRIPRWFLPISGDLRLRLHGRYQLQGNAGGTIQRCDPPRGFAATWEYGSQVSWIEVRLGGEPGDRTRLELEHIAPVDDQRGRISGAVGVGWDMGLVGLAIHLASRKATDRQESAGWVGSGEGKQFMSLSSERWCEANIAAGTNPEEAHQAAERTTTAYSATARKSTAG